MERRIETAGSATTLPRGLHGGTNGEVSWLRVSTRLPGSPVAVGVEAWPIRPGTRYSGGAAPALHRLPSSPVRVTSVFLQDLVYGDLPSVASEASSLAFSFARSSRYDFHSSGGISGSWPA
jgi:hypothetical protein